MRIQGQGQRQGPNRSARGMAMGLVGAMGPLVGTMTSSSVAEPRCRPVEPGARKWSDIGTPEKPEDPIAGSPVGRADHICQSEVVQP